MVQQNPNSESNLQDKIENLQNHNKNLQERLNNLEHLIHNLQNKSWLEIFATPLAVVLFTIIGGFWIQFIENKSAKQIADANLESKAVEMFFKYIDDDKIEQKKKGINILTEYINNQSVNAKIIEYAKVENTQNIALQNDKIEEIKKQKTDAKSEEEKQKLSQKLDNEKQKLNEYKELKTIIEQQQEDIQKRFIPAKITKPKDGMNLRRAPLSLEELQETVNKPDVQVGEVICSLPINHPIYIVEEYDRYTYVKAKCQGKDYFGYISNYGGTRPYQIIN